MTMIIIRVKRHFVPSFFECIKVDKLAPRYILEHWSKNVKKRHTHIKSSHDEPLFASELRAYDNVMIEMQEHKAKNKGKCLLSYEDASLDQINDLQNPPRVRTGGRYKNRLRSNTEKQMHQRKRKRKPLVRWWINDVAKFKPLSQTNYELSIQRFSGIR
ncbi:hypothetical protein Ahy_A02g008243 [Arachis hypogaea]|uniref:Protein FAR1-RELATED SEQUENCE n=1 Tax=Arachis hypogaea TaxID=3818 RepID=A0A445EE94_ARAHY|nr:hypothetical protein Ahy_A02g008243 [Arachis hypogaea]